MAINRSHTSNDVDSRVAQVFTRSDVQTESVTDEQIPLSEATAQLYQQRRYQSAWTGNDGLNRRGRKVMAVLESLSARDSDQERYVFEESPS